MSLHQYIGKPIRICISSVDTYEGLLVKVSWDSIPVGGSTNRTKAPVLHVLHTDDLVRQWNTKQPGLQVATQPTSEALNAQAIKERVAARKWLGGSQRGRAKLNERTLHNFLIEVWWEVDHCWYKGRVSANPSTKKGRSMHSVKYNDGEVEQLDLSAEVWRLAAEGEIEPSGAEDVLVNAQQDGLLITQFHDSKLRKRMRLYIETGQCCEHDEATFKFAYTNRSAKLTICPQDEAAADLTYCIELPLPVYTSRSPPDPGLPNPREMVDVLKSTAGKFQVTLFVMEPAASRQGG